MAKPDTVEDRPWGDVAWKVRNKCFVIGSEGGSRFTVKSTPEKQGSLVMHPNIDVAAYVGRFGWVAIQIDDEDTLELALDLIDESYELVAPKRKMKK